MGSMGLVSNVSPCSRWGSSSRSVSITGMALGLLLDFSSRVRGCSTQGVTAERPMSNGEVRSGSVGGTVGNVFSEVTLEMYLLLAQTTPVGSLL
jgi:hypothetical protein